MPEETEGQMFVEFFVEKLSESAKSWLGVCVGFKGQMKAALCFVRRANKDLVQLHVVEYFPAYAELFSAFLADVAESEISGQKQWTACRKLRGQLITVRRQDVIKKEKT